MKSLRIIILGLFIVGMGNSCLSRASGGGEDGQQLAETGEVEVHYFHMTRRCATCNAVEEVTREAVTTFYEGKVDFTSWNIDERDGKEKAQELGVSGQTLLIVKGDTKINLTNEAFLTALSDPDKLKQTIRESIDPLL
ncbi:MAG: nitrophenyl compound nitroreductase subunit ArsF family protein [Bacteroidales bacterium]